MREWLNKVNVSSFQLKNFSQIRACTISMKKQNTLTPQPCLHTPMQTRLSVNQSARTILVILQIVLTEPVW